MKKPTKYLKCPKCDGMFQRSKKLRITSHCPYCNKRFYLIDVNVWYHAQTTGMKQLSATDHKEINTYLKKKMEKISVLHRN